MADSELVAITFVGRSTLWARRRLHVELDAGFCPCERRVGHAEIARRTRRRERSAFRGGIGRVARRQLNRAPL
jgi:hypothetical protein